MGFDILKIQNPAVCGYFLVFNAEFKVRYSVKELSSHTYHVSVMVFTSSISGGMSKFRRNSPK